MLFDTINICFLFSICLLTALVSYTTWENLNVFLSRKYNLEYIKREVQLQYYAYLTKFNKSYGREEFEMRLENFKKSLEEISRLNSMQPGNVYGLNKFSDMSEKEFKRNMLTPVVRECKHLNEATCPPAVNIRGLHKTSMVYSKSLSIPPKFDWRDRKVVTDVLDQKQCHGCWAMSIVGVMETMGVNATGRLHRLSSQELIDCSTFNTGCKRGDVLEALIFLCLHDWPIVHERKYPLKLVDERCRMSDTTRKGMRIKQFNNICNMDSDQLLRVIAYHGPVVAVVNALGWLHYNGGIIQRSCASEWAYMDHVVQIVGYDLTDDVPYYIVRNSWGENFGDNGYLKIAIAGNVCGIRNNIAFLDVVYK